MSKSLLEIVNDLLPFMNGKEIIISVTQPPALTFVGEFPKLEQISEEVGRIISASIEHDGENQETLVCTISSRQNGTSFQQKQVRFVLADYICYIFSEGYWILSFSSRSIAMENWQTVTIG